MTVVIKLTENNATEALLASLDIISRVFGSRSVIEAYNSIDIEDIF
jgi:hypothetical protein